jgi:cell wall-associated NlpC family hydrolase
MRRLYLFTAIFILTIFISGNIYANTTYTIKKGDNPAKIAKKFKVSVQNIIKANNLRPKNLKPGTKITIPSNKKESSNKSKLVQKQDKKLAQNNLKTVKHPEDAQSHTVKKGDTLLSLSKKYSISVSKLKEINNLRTTKLRIGQKLLVKETVHSTYTVKKGDNIYKIAKRFNIDIDELKDINDLETDLLKPGQKILIEPEVEPDDLKTVKTKNYEAIISQARIDTDIEKVLESKELSDIGLQDRLILFAKKLLDIPYRFGGSSLLGIDCSAYVQKVYGLVGINLPRSAREQFSEGNSVDKEELSIGDLVFFKTYASFPSHVGIYLGNDLFIHASSRGRKVTIDSLETPYYFKRFIGAKRVIEEDPENKEEPKKEG